MTDTAGRTRGAPAHVRARERVTAVLVAHDGARWLPATLDALAALTRVPDRLIAVDTGSADASLHLLVDRLGEDAVLSLPRTTGFGAALAHAVAATGATGVAAAAASGQSGTDEEAAVTGVPGPTWQAAPAGQAASVGEAYPADGPGPAGGAQPTAHSARPARHAGKDRTRLDGPGNDGTGIDGSGVGRTRVDGSGVDGSGVDGAAGTGTDGAGVGRTRVDGSGVDGAAATGTEGKQGTGPDVGAHHGGEVDRIGHDGIEWLWILHDDCAPTPEALACLLAATRAAPDIAVAGPKVLGWHDRRLLLETGLTIAGNGRRETGLERREQDQGQHDGLRDVLAVGSAGMLVRRDVWDQLGGFDERIPLFRDDVDFGWRARRAGHRVVCVSDAVVHHAEAAARGRRRIAAGAQHVAPHHRHLLDRRSALYVLLVNAPPALLPLVVLRLVLGTLARATGYLIGKLPGDALDELRALALVLARPDRLAEARRARRTTASTPHREVRKLLASPGRQLHHAGEALAGMLGGGAGATNELGGRRRRDLPSDKPLDTGPLPWWRRALRHPGALLWVGLLALALVSARGLLGDGRLAGGALLPAPGGSADLWRTYVAGWHPVGLGSDEPAPPYLAVLGALAVLLLGSASAAVDLLLIGCVPLAALTAWIAVGRLVGSLLLRLWAAAAWALLPAATGAVASGRLGTAVLFILLPLVALAGVRAVGTSHRRGSWRAAWVCGLLLSIVVAFTPVAWALATPFALAGAVLLRGRARLKLPAALATPALLLGPWGYELLRRPGLLLTEAGLPQPDAPPDPLAAVLLNPGGPGTGATLAAAGLVIAALAALLRPSRRRAVLAGWMAIAVGTAGALLLSRAMITSAALGASAPAWTGPPVAVAAAGAIAAAVVGAGGIRARIAGTSFGWRQPLLVLVIAAACAAPVIGGLTHLVRGAGDPLQRHGDDVLPAFVSAEAAESARPRTLVLSGSASSLRYALLREGGPRLGDGETAATPTPELAAVVGELASGRGGDVVRRLATFAVRYVLLPAPADPTLVAALDGVPGLTRVSTQGGAPLWRLDAPAGRARVLASDGAVEVVLDSGDVGAAGTVTAGRAGRTLVLAERRDGQWAARQEGEDLAAVTVDGWAQGFTLLPGGGRVELRWEPGARPLWLLGQGALLLLVLLLALPAAQRDEDGEQPEDQEAVPAAGRHAATMASGSDNIAAVPSGVSRESRQPRLDLPAGRHGSVARALPERSAQ